MAKTAYRFSAASALYSASLPPLSKEDEVVLSYQAKGGNAKARETLIRANIRFALVMACKYQGHGLAFEDLCTEAVIGLIKAIEHFEPSRNARLVTCASLWIKNEIMQAINKCGSSPRLSDKDFRTLVSVKKAIGACPHVEDSAELLRAAAFEHGKSVEKIQDLLALNEPCVSLDAAVGAGDTSAREKSLGDLLSDCNAVSPEDAALKACFKDALYESLRALPAVERGVFMLRHGLNGCTEQNFAEIGAQYGKSRQWAFLKAKAAECRLAETLHAWAA